ncbi:MAG: glycosyltransferase family 4 protein [bacterium]
MGLRVAVLGSLPLDPGKIPGGVEAVIHNLSVSMAAIPGVDLHILTCIQGLKAPQQTDYRGMTVHYLPGQTRLGHLTDHALEQRRLRRALRDLAPDIIHAHGTGSYVAAALGSGIPVAVTVHGIRFREVRLHGGIRGYLRRVTTTALERRVLSRAEHIFVIAEYVRQAVAPLTRAHFHPIANPVSLRFFELPTTDTGSTILSVAAVQPRKGLLDLVEATAQVRRSVPGVRLRLVGKVLVPAYAEKLRRRISELGLDDCVELVGFIPDSELEREFTRCSVFALCSVEESSPVAIAEAMALGKPVVATAVGGIPDLVTDGLTGRLVKYGDVPGIAAALEDILENGETRVAMGEAARSRAQRDFHPAAAAAATVAVYRQILEGTRNS